MDAPILWPQQAVVDPGRPWIVLNGLRTEQQLGTVMETKTRTDHEILGYSRYVVAIAAFFAVFIVSLFEYAWSSISGHLAAIYGWSHQRVAWLFTLFII